MRPRGLVVVHRSEISVLQDQSLLRRTRCLARLVRGDDHCGSLCSEFADELVHESHSLRVEPGIRFIQKGQFEGPDPDLCEDDPLSHSGRERPNSLVRHPFQADARKGRPILVGTERQARHAGGEPEVLFRREIVIHVAAHGNQADPLADLVRLRAKIESAHRPASIRRMKQRRETLEQRRLAGTVRTYEREGGPAFHAQIDAAQHTIPPEPLRESDQLDGGGCVRLRGDIRLLCPPTVPSDVPAGQPCTGHTARPDATAAAFGFSPSLSALSAHREDRRSALCKGPYRLGTVGPRTAS